MQVTLQYFHLSYLSICLTFDYRSPSPYETITTKNDIHLHFYIPEVQPIQVTSVLYNTVNLLSLFKLEETLLNSFTYLLEKGKYSDRQWQERA